MEIPVPVAFTEADFNNEPHLRSFAGRYDQESNTLYYNSGWQPILDEAVQFARAGNLSDAETERDYHAALSGMISRMSNAIIEVQTMAVEHPDSYTADAVLTSFSEYGLSMAAIPLSVGSREIRRRVLDTFRGDLAWQVIELKDQVPTGRRGEVAVTRRELESVFGAPMFDDPTNVQMGDSTVEWSLLFSDGTVATIYDIDIIDEETGELVTPDLDEIYEWHIGGAGPEAVTRVLGALERARRERHL